MINKNGIIVTRKHINPSIDIFEKIDIVSHVDKHRLILEMDWTVGRSR